MSKNEKYVRFIDDICTSTDAGRVKWSYLEDDDSVINIFKKSDTQPGYLATFDSFLPMDTIRFQGYKFKIETSYFYKHSDYVNVLLSGETGKLCLLVTAGMSLRNAVVLDDSVYGVELVRLLAKIKKQFPDPESYIDKVINGEA